MDLKSIVGMLKLSAPEASNFSDAYIYGIDLFDRIFFLCLFSIWFCFSSLLEKIMSAALSGVFYHHYYLILIGVCKGQWEIVGRNAFPCFN